LEIHKVDDDQVTNKDSTQRSGIRILDKGNRATPQPNNLLLWI